MIFAALFAAIALAAAPVRHRKRKSHVSLKTSAVTAAAQRTALLALRREMLHDFLVETGTEAPAFRDARIVKAGGLRIGPTIVSLDFLGAPIVRARVRNASATAQDALLSARVRDAHGRTAQASTWIERLAAGESRTVEIFCPASLTPTAVDWTVTPLQ